MFRKVFGEIVKFAGLLARLALDRKGNIVIESHDVDLIVGALRFVSFK